MTFFSVARVYKKSWAKEEEMNCLLAALTSRLVWSETLQQVSGRNNDVRETMAGVGWQGRRRVAVAAAAASTAGCDGGVCVCVGCAEQGLHDRGRGSGVWAGGRLQGSGRGRGRMWSAWPGSSGLGVALPTSFEPSRMPGLERQDPPQLRRFSATI